MNPKKLCALLCAAAVALSPLTAFAEGAEESAEAAVTTETPAPVPVPEESAEETTAPAPVPEESAEETTAPESASEESAEETTAPVPVPEESTEEMTAPAPAPEERTEEATVTESASEGFEEIPNYDDSSIQTYAETDPFTYEANSTGVTITKYNGSDSVVTIPSTYMNKKVTALGVEAFSNNKTITKVIIPEGVTSIENSVVEFRGCFNGCTNLTSVTLPSTMKTIGGGAFVNCQNLTGISLPNNITSIGKFAFSSCRSLASVKMPSGLTSIGYAAFKNCESLKSLTIPSPVTSIGDYFIQGTAVTSVTLPDHCTTIGSNTFNGANALVSITLPAQLESVEFNSFTGCPALRTLSIASSNLKYATVNGILYSKDMKTLYRYPRGKTETRFTVPSGIKNLNRDAFFGNTFLTEVTLPESVSLIETCAFGSCTGLISLNVLNENASFNNWYVFQDVDTLQLTLYGYVGSTTETYCNNHSITFGIIRPQTPSIKVTAGDRQATLSWSPQKGIVKYRAFTYLNGKYTQVGETTGTSMTVKNLQNGTNYGFLVLAYNGSEWSKYTTADNVNATPIGIGLPTIKTAVGNNQVTVTWGAISGAKKYRIFTYQNGKYTQRGETTGTSFIVKNLSGGTRYGFLVLAFDGKNWSKYTTANNVYATPNGIGLPAIKTAVGNNQVTVTWGAISGAKKYRIFTYQNGKYTQRGETTGTSFVVKNLSGGTRYGFLVLANNGSVWSPYTVNDVAYATPNGIGLPAIKTAVGNNQVTVTWGAISGAKKYRIFTYQNGKYTQRGETRGTSFVVKNLSGGTRYGFLVLANNGSVWSPYTVNDVVYATPNGIGLPAIKTAAGKNQVTVTWGAVSGAKKYRIFTYQNGKYTQRGETTGTSFVVRNLSGGTRYGFLVLANNGSAWSPYTVNDVVYATPNK